MCDARRRRHPSLACIYSVESQATWKFIMGTLERSECGSGLRSPGGCDPRPRRPGYDHDFIPFVGSSITIIIHHGNAIESRPPSGRPSVCLSVCPWVYGHHDNVPGSRHAWQCLSCKVGSPFACDGAGQGGAGRGGARQRAASPSCQSCGSV